MKDEFVMVRRSVLADACSFDDGTRLSAQHAIEDLLAKPSEQHQGEPVHMVRPHGSCCWEETSGEGLDICLSMPEEYEIRKLYTLADPGEVERLREGISKHWKVVCDQRAELDTLRAQRAKWDALLRDILNDITGRGWSGGCAIPSRIESALSGSAEPSAPVERDERAEFEKWFDDRSKDWAFPSEAIKGVARDNDWSVWQARAALERKL